VSECNEANRLMPVLRPYEVKCNVVAESKVFSLIKGMEQVRSTMRLFFFFKNCPCTREKIAQNNHYM